MREETNPISAQRVACKKMIVVNLRFVSRDEIIKTCVHIPADGLKHRMFLKLRKKEATARYLKVRYQ